VSDESAPVIIMVAPNGPRRTKADHPALPISPAELAAEAASCADSGAALFHIHVRDSQGRHLLDAEAYRAATAAIRREVGERLIVQVTTEAVGTYAPAQQMAVIVELKPEAVSLAIGEIVPGPEHEKAAAAFFAWLHRERITPQYILYDPGEVRRFRELRRRGIIPGDATWVIYPLGKYKAGQASEPVDLLPALAAREADDDSIWAACAFGARENACVLAAAALGGHPRVGFENNMHLADGRLAPSNAALVDQLRQGLALMGCRLADAAAARELAAPR